MPIRIADRLTQLPGYAFAEVDAAADALKEQGITPIDFGVGDHTLPTPAVARERAKAAIDTHATTGYPSYIGMKEYREAIAAWMKRRYGLQLDPATQISTTIGSKEGVFNLPLAFCNPGDVVIAPSPGYPPYYRGTLFAGAETYVTPLKAENDWLIDFTSIPTDIAKRAKMLWICYPNSPTGVIAPDSFFEEAVRFCRDHDILLCSDEAYSEIYFGERKPRSVLEFADEGVLATHSMSKRSMMTGWRVGWVSGPADVIAAFKKLKTNIDSGTPNFVQEGAIAALEDETHVQEMVSLTKQKRDILADGLVAAGLPDCRNEATLYLWQQLPAGTSSIEFAKRLLDPSIAIVCVPGAAISEPDADGNLPGEGYVRFSLVPGLDEVKEAAARLSKLTF